MKIYFFAIATLLFMPNLLLGFIIGSFSEKFSAVDIYGLAVVAIAFFIFFYMPKHTIISITYSGHASVLQSEIFS